MLAGGLAFLASTLVPAVAHADPPAPAAAGVTIYTIKTGDSCASIARSFYGDARRVDLIHNANPQLGAQPHKLKPGSQLTLPPKATEAPKGPDARLAFVRNKVEVFAPDQKTGQLNDPLFRGNRVSTLDASSANVLFRDETELRLGEDTLIVILGDQNASASKVGSDTTLVTGNLRAQLGALAGRTPKAIATPSGSVTLGTGEAKIHIDDKKTTRLAVYKGTSSITAQQKKVDVQEGMGSKAEKGKLPTPPRPLPAAPTWGPVPDPILFTVPGGDAELAAGYAAGPGVAAASFHLQLARDAAFNELALDTRVPVSVDKLEVHQLKPGSYFARVSAIDNDEFEGPFVKPIAFTVARLARKETGPHELEVVAEGAPVECGLDNNPRKTTPIKVDRRVAHTLRCVVVGPAKDGEPAPVVTSIAVPADDVVFARAQARWVGLDAIAHVGDIAIDAFDADDMPIVGARLTATASDPKVVLGNVERSYKAGVYFVHVRGLSDGAKFKLRVRSDDGVEVDTGELEVPVPPVVPVEQPVEYSVALLGTGTALNRGGQIGFGGALDVGAAFPANFGALTLNLRFGVERYGGTTPVALTPATPGPQIAAESTHTDYVVSLPLGYRFGDTKARLAPYLAIAPQLQFQNGTAVTASGDRATGNSKVFAVMGTIGLDLRAGPGSFFLEAGYREGVALDDAPFYTPLDGGFLGLGYRLSPVR